MQNDDSMAAGVPSESRWFRAYAGRVVGNPWRTLLVILLPTFFLIFGARFLLFNNDYRIFFSDDNPQLQAFEKLQQTYTKNDNVLFAITPRDGEVFDREVLAGVRELTSRAWTLPYALRVDSITNFPYTEARGDDLVVHDLVQDPLAMSAADLQTARERALAEPFLRNLLINENASVTGVNVTFQMPQKGMEEEPEVVNASRELAAAISADYPLDVRLSGSVVMSNSFYEAAIHDLSTLSPLMYLVILVVAYGLLRSVAATALTLVIVFISMLAALGGAGWAGIQLTPPSASAATIIMTLAVADSIHILLTVFTGLRRGLSRAEAVRYSLRLNTAPVVLTSVTTAIGFLSMNFSDAPPFRDLGNITAFGVMLAMVFSLTLLPAAAALLPLRARSVDQLFGRKLEALGDWVIRRQRPLLAATLGLTALVCAAIPLNHFDDNFIRYFGKAIQFRNDTDYINRNLTGVYQLQFSLESGREYGVSDPDFLSEVDGFTQWLRDQPEVVHVTSVVDTVKRINANLHGNDDKYYRIPPGADEAAQYLLLYELSLPLGMDLNNQMDISRSATQVVVSLGEVTSVEMRAFSDRAADWLRSETGLETQGIGHAMMFAHLADRIARSMISGTLLALLLISILISVFLRSVTLGILSVASNLLPIAFAFGIWGFFVGEINAGVSLVAGMVIGIVVDDTVHFLCKYLRARREDGLSPVEALRHSFATVGVAMVVTSVILVAGFIVLAQSQFAMNSTPAFLTAIAITAALLVVFLLFPPLLLIFDRQGAKQSQTGLLKPDQIEEVA